MTESFWRTEVWHPLTVHFPIALLVFSTLVFFISFVLPSEKRLQWQKFSIVLLFAGTVGAWVALYTGDLADGVVARKICDPLLLKDHEIAAQTSTYLFTAACVIILLLNIPVINAFRKIIIVIVVAIMATGCVYLTIASHAGATLVYNQGAGVLNHPHNCN